MDSNDSEPIHVDEKLITNESKLISRTPLTAPLANIINRIVTLRENDSHNEAGYKPDNINSNNITINKSDEKVKTENDDANYESEIKTMHDESISSNVSNTNCFSNSSKQNISMDNTNVECSNITYIPTNLKPNRRESYDSTCISDISQTSSTSQDDEKLLCKFGDRSSRRSSIKSSQEIQDYALTVMAKETIRASIPILKLPKNTMLFDYPSREDVPAVTRMNTRMNSKSSENDKSVIILKKNGNNSEISKSSKIINTTKIDKPSTLNNISKHINKSIKKPSTVIRENVTTKTTLENSSLQSESQKATYSSPKSPYKTESKLSMPKFHKNRTNGISTKTRNDSLSKQKTQSTSMIEVQGEKSIIEKKQSNTMSTSETDKSDIKTRIPVKPIRKTKKVAKTKKENKKLTIDEDKLTDLPDKYINKEIELPIETKSTALKIKNSEKNSPSVLNTHRQSNISPPMMKPIQNTSTNTQKSGLRHPLQRTSKRTPQHTPQQTPHHTPHHTPQHTPHHTPRTTLRDIPQKSPHSTLKATNITKHPTKKNIQPSPKQIPQHLPLQHNHHPIQQTHQHPSHSTSVRRKSASRERQIDNVKPQIHRSLTRKHTIEKPELSDDYADGLTNSTDSTLQSGQNGTISVSELISNFSITETQISTLSKKNESPNTIPKRTSNQSEPPADTIIQSPNMSPNLSISTIMQPQVQSMPSPKSTQIKYIPGSITPPPSLIKYTPTHRRSSNHSSSTPKSKPIKSILSPNMSPIKYIPFAETKKYTTHAQSPESLSDPSNTSRLRKMSNVTQSNTSSSLKSSVNNSTIREQAEDKSRDIANGHRLKQNQVYIYIF